MAEYIGCRECDSPYCKGCNLKNLETMLCNGKFDCIMNENRCIKSAADVSLVRHGRWEKQSGLYSCSECGRTCPYDVQADVIEYWTCNYCPNCGAKMDECNEPEN